MKILMSAFSCGPGRGSEPGVGWNMALSVARLGHDVTVLTQSEFREEIEREIAAGRVPANLRFDIFMPTWLERARDAGVRYGLASLIWQPVSLVWQFCALAHARRKYRETHFDLVHHVTFAQVRHPTLLTRMGWPTVLGPLGGGDRAPMQLRRSFPWKVWWQELVRDAYGLALRIDPVTRLAFRDATLILLRTNGALQAVPPRHRHKALVRPGAAISEQVDGAVAARARGEDLRMIYAGHLYHFKGVHLGLRALAEARTRGAAATLTVVGDGPSRSDLEQLAEDLGLSPYVTWCGQVPRQQLLGMYRTHHALLFPSLRDAAATVIVEGWAYGLPTLCFALGGTGEMVDSSCGRAIAAEGRSEAQCVEDLATAISAVAHDDDLRKRLATGALSRYRACGWESVAARLYAEIEARLRTTTALTTGAHSRMASTVAPHGAAPQASGIGRGES